MTVDLSYERRKKENSGSGNWRFGGGGVESSLPPEMGNE
jgi:hypothetical protein